MDSISRQYNFNRRNFLILWILANMLGPAIGMVIIGFIGYESYKLPSSFFRNTVFLLYLVILLVNIIVGGTEQGIFLHYIKISVRWLRLTTLAAILDILLWLLVALPILQRSDDAEHPYSLLIIVLVIISFALFGLVFGVLQWLALRKIVKRAGHWIWISFVSCTIFFCVTVFFFLVASNSGFNSGGSILLSLLYQILVIGLPGGAASGAMTGLCLLWLLKKPANEFLAKASSPSLQDASQSQGL